MYFSACHGKRGGSRIRASEAQHLILGIDEFLNDSGVISGGCLRLREFWMRMATRAQCISSPSSA
jgi:hypothetical protein